jgi:hypothetical protein
MSALLLDSLLGVLGKLESSMFHLSSRINYSSIVGLQQLYKYTNLLHQSTVKVLQYISLRTCNKFLQTIVLPYMQWGSKRGTYITSPKELHPTQGCTSTLSLLGLSLRNQHIVQVIAYLLMLFTYNKGLTNPKY